MKKDIFAIIVIVLVALGFYALTLRGVVGNIDPGQIKGRLDTETKPFELSPERGRFAGVLSLAERGTYDLGRDLATVVYPDVGYYEDRYYSFFAPGMAYLVRPFYELGHTYGLSQVATFAFVSLAAVGCLVFLYLIARYILRMPVVFSILGSLVYGFATTSWSYAITLYQHHLTSLFLFSGFYAAWKFSKGGGKFSWVWGLWVWASCGLAISIDYPNALLMLPVMAYFLFVSFKILPVSEGAKIIFRPSVLIGAVLFAAIVAANLKFSQDNFGNWKTLAGQLPGFQLERQEVAPDSQVLVQEAIAGKGLVSFFSDTNIPKSFYTLFFSLDRGLLVFSPVMLLGFLGLLKARKALTGNREKYFLMGIIGVNVLLYSSWGDPWGGWAYGPRYLIPSMAALSLFASYWLFSNRGKILPGVIALLLLAYSSAIALLGAVTSNSVPPAIEAVNLPLKYSNFLYNLLLLKNNETGSFAYNTFFAGRLDLQTYSAVIYVVLLSLLGLLIFFGQLAPLLNKSKLNAIDNN